MYILECADGSYYTGSSIDLERRLWQHQNGLGANHTAKRLPVKLVYCEFFEHVADAFKREKQVQGWTRRKKEALMAGDSNLLHQFAECQNDTHFDRLDRLDDQESIDLKKYSYLNESIYFNKSSYLSGAEDSGAED
jgi:putative endonuclease